MTIIQLEYIVAVDTYRSFVAAARQCFVTQPSLSMQIHKLEEELDVVIFDRSKNPVAPTQVGKLVVEQAKAILEKSRQMRELVASTKNKIEGILRIGIIPTLAPYLLPPLVAQFSKAYPKVKLEVWEYTTDIIVEYLKMDKLDCGLIATPVNEDGLVEKPLFYENFVVYTSSSNSLYQKKVIREEDLPSMGIWVLNEGHCMRNQVLNICSRKAHARASKNLEYNTGSVETLKRLVETNAGWTVLNELSIQDFSADQLDNVRFFRTPEPVREISLVTNKHFVKKGLASALEEEINQVIPTKMRAKGEKKVISIDRKE